MRRASLADPNAHRCRYRRTMEPPARQGRDIASSRHRVLPTLIVSMAAAAAVLLGRANGLSLPSQRSKRHSSQAMNAIDLRNQVGPGSDRISLASAGLKVYRRSSTTGARSACVDCPPSAQTALDTKAFPTFFHPPFPTFKPPPFAFLQPRQPSPHDNQCLITPFDFLGYVCAPEQLTTLEG